MNSLRTRRRTLLAAETAWVRRRILCANAQSVRDLRFNSDVALVGAFPWLVIGVAAERLGEDARRISAAIWRIDQAVGRKNACLCT